MRKLLAVLVVVALAAAVAYAGTYQITTTTAQDNRLEKHRVRLNKSTCNSYGLADDCTQAQCRALAPGCNVYSTVADLIDRVIVKDYTDSLRVKDTADDQSQFCKWWAAANTTQRNAICSASGLPNGCEICN